MKPNKKKNKERKFPLNDTGIDVVSGASSALAALSTHPLDTLAVQKQSGGSSLEQHIKDQATKAKKGTQNVTWEDLDKVRKNQNSQRAGKFRKLWKGVGSKAAKALPATVIGFVTFEGTKRGLKGWRNNYENSADKTLLESIKKKDPLEKNGEYQKLIEKYPLEKNAFLGAAAKFLAKSPKKLMDFSKGFAGFGKMSKPATAAGLGASLTVPRKFTKSKALKDYGKVKDTFADTSKFKTNNFK